CAVAREVCPRAGAALDPFAFAGFAIPARVSSSSLLLDAIGQIQTLQGAVRALESEGFVFLREVDDGEELRAGARRDRVDDVARVLIAAQQPRAGDGRRCACTEVEHAALDCAAVVRARDDLLSGVTALLEADAAEQIEIQHLRDEAFVRRRIDLRMTGTQMIVPPLCFGAG